MRLKSFYRIATAARDAFIARRGPIVEVVAARALHQIAASGGHVAKLSGGAHQNRLREQRIFLANSGCAARWLLRTIAPIRRPPSGSSCNFGERKTRDIHESIAAAQSLRA